MKKVFVLAFVWVQPFFGYSQQAVNDSSPAPPVAPLFEAIEHGGIEKLNSFLEGGGKWPKITTDFAASKGDIEKHKELARLSDKVLNLLKEIPVNKANSDVKQLGDRAGLLFSLAEKLWMAGGYRNLAMSLICSELGSYDCARIAILTKGASIGPLRPESLQARDADQLLALFISLIPEISGIADSEVKEKLEKMPVTGKSWFEMISKIRNMEVGGSTVGTRYNGIVDFRSEPIGSIVSKEDLSSLVNHFGWSNVVQNSIIPELAIYLKNNGSLEQLAREPANSMKFKEVLKDDVFRFTLIPVLDGRVGVGQMAIFVQDLQDTGGVQNRIFGDKE